MLPQNESPLGLSGRGDTRKCRPLLVYRQSENAFALLFGVQVRHRLSTSSLQVETHHQTSVVRWHWQPEA